MSKRAGNTMFQSTSSPLPGNEKEGVDFESIDIYTIFSHMNDFFTKIKEFDTTSLEYYWVNIVFMTKTIVFICLFCFFWKWVLKPYLKNRRLNQIKQQL